MQLAGHVGCHHFDTMPSGGYAGCRKIEFGFKEGVVDQTWLYTANIGVFWDASRY